MRLSVDWFGMPGKSIGGFNSSIGTDRLLPPYRASRQAQDSMHFEQVALPEAGTKSIQSEWTTMIDPPLAFGQLQTIPGAMDLLSGTLSNPLPMDLINGVLMYRGRSYALPNRMRTGDVTNFSVTSSPKDLARRLQRRFNVDGKESGKPWDRSDFGDLKRLAENLAFHKASGGNSYTIGQENRYLSSLDQSDLLKTERAILFAELSQPEFTWSIGRNQETSPIADGNVVTFLRVVLPVEKGASQLPSSSEPPRDPSR
jgi:hypothetical protein